MINNVSNDSLKAEVARLQAEILRLRIELTQTRKQITVPRMVIRQLLRDAIREMNVLLDTLNAM